MCEKKIFSMVFMLCVMFFSNVNCFAAKESLKLSVIIPVYNVEKYVEKCMDSVVGQNYENL